MNVLLVAPLLLVVVGVVLGSALPRLAAPPASVRVLTAVTAASAAGVVAALALVAVAGASELHAVSSWLGWCEALTPGDHGAAPWIGALAAAVLAATVGRAVHHARRIRAEVVAVGPVDGVEVVAASGAVAFAVPGTPGGIVLGDELVRSLSGEERRAVVAHEQAHLDHGHHRFVHVAETCAAAFPFLRPLARQVRFDTERWADEIAAVEVGSRRLVARAIARVALLGVPDRAPGVLGVAAGSGATGVAARIDALLLPPASRPLPLPAVATVAVTVAGSSVQLHHLVAFFGHVCR